MSTLNPRDETLLGPDLFSQLLLREARFTTLRFQTLSYDEGVALHLELIPLLGPWGAKILGNQFFDGRQNQFLIILFIHTIFYSHATQS